MIQQKSFSFKFSILNFIISLLLLSACSHIERPAEKIQPTDNPQTIALYEDCKAYLVDEDKEKHFCPTIIDIALMSSWSGTMYMLGAIRNPELQERVLNDTKEYMQNELECTPENEPLLRYGGGVGIKDAVAKFVKEVPKNPDWKKVKPSEILGYILISSFCMDHYGEKLRLAQESKDK